VRAFGTADHTGGESGRGVDFEACTAQFLPAAPMWGRLFRLSTCTLRALLAPFECNVGMAFLFALFCMRLCYEACSLFWMWVIVGCEQRDHSWLFLLQQPGADWISLIQLPIVAAGLRAVCRARRQQRCVGETAYDGCSGLFWCVWLILSAH
jgi:hypothetical protein